MFRKKLKTNRWCVLDYLKTDEEIACFLEAAIEENDDKYLKIAVRDAIQALRNRNDKDSKKS